MRIINLLIITFLSLALSGCVVSLHPLYTEKDLVFDPNIEGTWVQEGEGNLWTFKKSGDKEYQLIYREKEETAVFRANLVSLKKYRFLDLFPGKPELGNEFYKCHFIPAHSFLKVQMENGKLKLALPRYQWVKNMLEDQKLSIPLEQVDDRIFFTASTEQLQQFMLAIADEKEAFDEPAILNRQE